jgi:hypothetical protein
VITLERPASWKRASEAFAKERVVRLTGDGGTGKSAILKRLAQAFDGPRIVLKDNRVCATSLVQHLSQLGIDSKPAELLDLAGRDGEALCVIDGADRLLMSAGRGSSSTSFARLPEVKTLVAGDRYQRPVLPRSGPCGGRAYGIRYF